MGGGVWWSLTKAFLPAGVLPRSPKGWDREEPCWRVNSEPVKESEVFPPQSAWGCEGAAGGRREMAAGAPGGGAGATGAAVNVPGGDDNRQCLPAG